MAENSLWLSTSLFCSKNHWNILLSDGIKPFIMSMPDEEELASFQIEFNYLNGENIRLALLTKVEQAETLAKKADTYFKKFFSISALPTNKPDLTDWGIFMPFPSNTIQYGLFKIDPLNLHDTKTFSFQKELSLIIADGLSEENIDQETIITFAFYLHVALIKLIKDKNPATINELLQWYDTTAFHKTEEPMDMEFLKAKYEDNKEVLLEITEDIIKHPSSVNKVPDWLEGWMDLCEKELISYTLKEGDKTLTQIHSRITYYINKQLGITEEMKWVLYYFISQTIFL